jgi:hypothetical protein
MTVAGPGERALRDVVDGAAVRLGEVGGQLLDDGREHDADEDGADDEHARVDRVARLRCGDAADGLDLGPGGGHVGVHRDDDEHGADDRRDEEAAVDGRHARAVLGPRRDGEDADDCGDDADGGDDQGKDQSERAERGDAQDEGGDQGDGVGLEEVGRHAGAVADVVADVVGDGGGVARVVLGDALLDLADQVGADVGSLREDASADTHEHGEQCGAEAEALEDLGCLALVDEHHEGRAEEAEADGEHAGDSTGAEGDLHGLLLTGVACGGGDAHVAAHGQPHAHVARDAGEDRSHDEEDAAPDALAAGLSRQQEQDEEDDHREDREGLELTAEVRGGALLHGRRDVLHLLRALVGGEHLTDENGGNAESGECDDRNHDHRRVVASGQLDHGTPRSAPW